MSIPDRIGPYEVLRPIARGGMAEVFEVRDPLSGSRLAVKLLMDVESSVARFNREFEALTRLNHPNIVRVYTYGYQEGKPWISMDLLEGVPLQVRVKSFGPPGQANRTREVIRLGYYVARALQYVHERGLVHRDVKSANVQVLADGRVKLLDFGTAHLTDPLEQITQEGDFVGTFSYAPPEQVMGLQVDHLADLYALGVLLYRLSTGRKPFKSRDPRELAQMQLTTQPKAPRELVRNLPPELDQLIRRLMEKKKRDRIQSAAEVARILEAIYARPMHHGQEVMVRSQVSVGRDEQHRRLWQVVAASKTQVVGFLAASRDRKELRQFREQGEKDAERREALWVPIEAGAFPLHGMWKALRQLMITLTPSPTEPPHWTQEVFREHELLPFGGLESILRAAIEVVASRIARSARPTVFVMDHPGELGALELELLQSLLSQIGVPSAGVTCLIMTDPGDQTLRQWRRILKSIEVASFQPLSPAAVGRAAGDYLLRRPPSSVVARQLWERSAGRPERLLRLLQGLSKEGALQASSDDAERVDWSTVSDGLTKLSEPNDEDFVGELPMVGRRVMEAIYVADSPLSKSVISAVLGWSADSTEVALLGLEQEGWLERQVDGRWFVPEWVVCEVIGRQMHRERRTLIERVLADADPRGKAGPSRVSVLLSSGRAKRGVQMALSLAQGQIERGDLEGALRLMERVRPYLNAPGVRSGEKFLHALYRAQIFRGLRPLDPAGPRALQLATRLASSEDESVQVMLAKAEIQGVIGHYANFRKYLLEAWAVAQKIPTNPIASTVALRIGQSHLQSGQLRETKPWLDTAITMARQANAGLEEGLARVALARLMTATGGLEQAEATCKAILSDRKLTTYAEVRWEAQSALAEVYRRSARYTELLEGTEAALSEARSDQITRSMVNLLLVLAWSEVDLYRLGRAQEFVDELSSILGPGEHLYLRLRVKLLLGRIQLASGQYHDAGYTLVEVVNQSGKAGLAVISSLARCYLGEVRACLGDRPGAQELYSGGLMNLLKLGHYDALVEAIMSRCRVLGPQDDPRKILRLAGPLITNERYLVLQMSRQLAMHRWMAGKSAVDAPKTLRKAEKIFVMISSSQGEIERAALRVHPWVRQLRTAAS